MSKKRHAVDLLKCVKVVENMVYAKPMKCRGDGGGLVKKVGRLVVHKRLFGPIMQR